MTELLAVEAVRADAPPVPPGMRAGWEPQGRDRAAAHDAFLRGMIEVCGERMLNLEHKLDMLLDLGCRCFGLAVGIVSQAGPGGHAVLNARGEGAPAPGMAHRPLRATGERGFGAPIRAGREAWGAVEFHGRNGERVDRRDEALLLTLAAWIGNEMLMRREAERLMDERERFRELYRATPAMMHAIDRNGTIRHVSDLWLERMGYRHDEVVGCPAVDFLDGASRRVAAERIPELLREGEAREVPLTFVCKDGSRMEGELTAVSAGEGRSAQMRTVVTDIGERNRALRDLTAANQDLDRLNKSLREFAYVASHDLQEPLRKIAQFSSFLAEDYADALDEQGHYYVERLTSAAQRMARLIRDLLAYSRAANAQVGRKPVDLHALVEALVGDFEVAIEASGARVERDPLPVLLADPVRLGQLMRNLIGNALKYRRPDVPPVVAITASGDAAGGVAITVSDNGIGFAPEYAAMIFEPFRRLHNREEYEGSGIGLALCRAICERLGWTIDARGEPGRGATFTIGVPGCDVAPRPAPGPGRADGAEPDPCR